jgi:hypothetical protein
MQLPNPLKTRSRSLLVCLAGAVIVCSASRSFAAEPQQRGATPGQSAAEVVADIAKRLVDDPTTGADAVPIFPLVVSGSFELPDLGALSTSTDIVKDGRIPVELRGDEESPTVVLPEDGIQRGSDWQWSVSNWAAADTFSHPRYFEDRMLERHGHQRFPRLQPFVSGARFFTTVPALPYLMAVRPACDYEYSLGYYRSGSRTPGFLQRPPLDRRGVISEAAWVSGAILAFP